MDDENEQGGGGDDGGGGAGGSSGDKKHGGHFDISNPLKNAARRGMPNPANMRANNPLSGRGGPKGTKRSIVSVGRVTAQASAAAFRGILAFFATPPGIVTLVLIAATIFIFYMLFADEVANQPPTEPDPAVRVRTTCPPQAVVGQEFTCAISATYPGIAKDFIIIDTYFDGLEYVSSIPEGKHDATGRKVTWSMSDAGILLTSPLIFGVTVTFRVLGSAPDKLYQKIQAYPVEGSVSAGAAANYVPANRDNCGGKANLGKNPLGNFGDPACDYTNDELYTFLKLEDPLYAELWYLTIVVGESSYNPNAWAAPVGQQASLDAGGAWGNFQMGSSTPPGTAPPAPGKNGEFDRGDVNWKMQAKSAIQYNRNQNCSFRYWATARSKWGAYKC